MKDHKEGEPENMSVEKRRNILVGFGGVAIALAVAIVLLWPNFRYRSEDASGAIGAVQKHRAPQITQNDVVLADEQTKQSRQILYVDFLNDAAALQNFSADLAAASRSAGSRANVGSVARSLEARSADIQARYVANMDMVLAAIKSLGNVEALGKVSFQDFNFLHARQLGVADMQQLSARLSSIVNDLASAECCEAALNARSLRSAEASLASFSADLQARKKIGSDFELASLASAIEADQVGARIRAGSVYLDALASEAMSLAAATRALQARSLDARALESISADLASRAQSLEARALKNMEENLASDEAAVDAMGRMALTLNSAEQSLDSSARSLDAMSLESARRNLASFSADLQNETVDLQARAAIGMREQLAVVSRYFDARSQIGNFETASLASFTEHIGSLSRSIDNRATLASAISDVNLAAQAQELASRAENLQARRHAK